MNVGKNCWYPLKPSAKISLSKMGRHRMLSGLDAFGTFNLQRFPDAPGIFGGVHKDDVAVAKLRLLFQ